MKKIFILSMLVTFFLRVNAQKPEYNPFYVIAAMRGKLIRQENVPDTENE